MARLAPRTDTLVVAYHKPKGLLTTHDDELGRETVYDRLRTLLPGHLRAIDWHAIGRLDADTTGLLLFTNDGALVHHATQPMTKLPKTYRVLAKGLLDDDQVRRLREGVELTGGLGASAPAEVEIEGFQKATTWVVVRIGEGKNRQVRRMLLAVGSQVIRLCRTHFGGIALEGLDEGGWRLLSDEEVEDGLGYVPRQVRTGLSARPPRAR